MASMAAIGALKVPSSSATSSSSSSSSNLGYKAAVRGLSFSSSALFADNIHSKAFSGRHGFGYNERTPIIVSPQAVSDFKNLQTCLDPDVSRELL